MRRINAVAVAIALATFLSLVHTNNAFSSSPQNPNTKQCANSVSGANNDSNDTRSSAIQSNIVTNREIDTSLLLSQLNSNIVDGGIREEENTEGKSTAAAGMLGVATAQIYATKVCERISVYMMLLGLCAHLIMLWTKYTYLLLHILTYILISCNNKAFAMGLGIMGTATIGDINTQSIEHTKADVLSQLSPITANNQQTILYKTSPSSQITTSTNLLLADETTATSETATIDNTEELSSLLEKINIDAVQKVRETAKKEQLEVTQYKEIEMEQIEQQANAEKRLEQERLDNIEAERKAEEKQLDADRLEQERLDNIEAERKAQEEQFESERLEQERLDNIKAERKSQEEKLEAERLEQERLRAFKMAQEEKEKGMHVKRSWYLVCLSCEANKIRLRLFPHCVYTHSCMESTFDSQRDCKNRYYFI